MARSFDGTNDYLTYATPILTATPLTIAAWFNTDTVSGAHAIFCIGGEDSGVVQEFAILIVNNQFWALTQANFNNQAVSTAALSSGTWYHGCGVFAGTSARSAFINGANKGTEDTFRDPITFERTRIGQRGNDDNDQKFDGLIAEISIWRVALTDPEVYLLSKGIPSYLIRPRYLQAYIPLLRDEDMNVISPRYLTNLSAYKFIKSGAPGVAPHPSGIIREAFANSLTFDPATNWPEYRQSMPSIINHIPSTPAEGGGARSFGYIF